MNDLVSAIRGAPDDDRPRLVYADALSEKNDPLGELIQVQVELARLPRKEAARREKLEERESALYQKHEKKWLKPIVALGATGGELRRGLLEVARVPAAILLDRAKRDQLLAAAPFVRAVEIEAPDDAALAAIADSDALAPFPEVTFSKMREATPRAVAKLAGAKALAGIRSLTFHESLRVREAVGTAMSRSPHLGQLESLTFHHTLLGSVGLRTMLGAKTLPRLRKLRLHRSNVQDAGAVALAGKVTLKLEHLELSSCDFTPKSAKTFLNAELVGKLTTLAMRNFYWSKNTVQALVESKQLRNLRVLDLAGSSIDGDEGAKILAGAKNLPKLERLVLDDYSFEDEGRAVLAKRFGDKLEIA